MSPSTNRPAPSPYTDVSSENMTLRDHLAVDRTVLANERTLLAYARTALALFIAGISLVHLPYLNPKARLDIQIYAIVGWSGVAVSAIVVLIGYLRYRRFRSLIRAAGQPSE